MSKTGPTRFNPPPNWKVKKGFLPPAGWQPDPAWGPAPEGWPMYVTEQKKTHRLRNAFGVLVLLIVVIAVAVHAGDSSSSTAAPAAASGGAPTAAAQNAKTPAKTAPAVAAHIGTKVTAGDFDFVVTSFTCGAKSVGGEFGTKAQGKFCLAKMTVTNHGNSASTFDDSSQHLYDTQLREYDADSTADIYIPGDDVFLADINPGNTVHGTVAFDVPAAGFKLDHLALVSGLGVMDTPANVSVK